MIDLCTYTDVVLCIPCRCNKSDIAVVVCITISWFYVLPWHDSVIYQLIDFVCVFYVATALSKPVLIIGVEYKNGPWFYFPPVLIFGFV